MMVHTIEGLNKEVKDVAIVDYTKKIKVVYPKSKEELIDFFILCKIKGYEVVLYPHYNAVFDKEETKTLKYKASITKEKNLG